MVLLNPSKDYKGKRAALYLRVSTADQEKMYGLQYQERDCFKFVEALGMRLNSDRHIVKDAYTGTEYFERPELMKLIEMAKRREFDAIIMWKLDRFGRKGLQREIIREQLKYYGVTTITLDPNEHADDDSPIGELIRLIYGFKAEQERIDIIERTTRGKRERAMQGKLLGAGFPLYGYRWRSNKPKEKDAYVLNLEIVKVDENGTEWTEVKVVNLIFELADKGTPIRAIARYLNEKGIPTRKGKMWQPPTLHQMLTHPFYTGEATMFKQKGTEKKPGKKRPTRIIRPEEDQIKMPEGVVPQVIDKALFERVQARLEKNKREATRNNKNPRESLLRSGFAKCGYCGGNVHFRRQIDKCGPGKDLRLYTCTRGNRFGTCKGCSIAVHTLDSAAWQHALEIIRDPSQVDKRINALQSDDPTKDRRKSIKSKLASIREQQNVLRERLVQLKLDKGTEEFINQRLNELAKEEQGYLDELNNTQNTYEQWNKLQERLKEFHQRCAKMRDQLDDPDFESSYEFKRDACEFFGIQAVVWRQGHKPRFKIESNPPSIVTLLS